MVRSNGKPNDTVWTGLGTIGLTPAGVVLAKMESAEQPASGTATRQSFMGRTTAPVHQTLLRSRDPAEHPSPPCGRSSELLPRAGSNKKRRTRIQSLQIVAAHDSDGNRIPQRVGVKENAT